MHQRNLIAQNPDGGFVNVKVGFDGKLSTDSQKTALGGVLSTRLTPVIQEGFQHIINTRVWNMELKDTGEIVHDNAKVVLSAGDTLGSSAEITSKKRIRCRPGMGAVVRFTAFWGEGDGKEYTSLIGVGDGDDKDGFYFMMSDNGFAITHYKDGVVVSTITQANWDDPCDGTSIMPVMDWGMGNTFEIKYQYLGYGPIRFYIENPKSGDFQLIHTIKYANANEEPSLSNPTLPFRIFILNDGVDGAMVTTTYVACFVEGENKIMGIPNVYTYTDEVTKDVKDNAFTIRNNANFNGMANQSMVYPQYINISNTDTETAVVSLISNTTLGGTPAYVDVDGKTSAVSVDEAGTSITGGTVLATILVGPASTERFSLKEYDIQIVPSEILTIAHITKNAGGSAIVFTLGWIEEQ